MPTIETITTEVTPDMAREWLYTANTNRPLRRALVDFYARSMQNGEWVLTHQGIAFDEEGKLSDGQHRLEAIVQADCTVPMQVSRGIAIELPIDRGAPRTLNDRLTMRYGSSKRMQAAILNVLRSGYGGLSQYRVSRLTDTEAVALYESHRLAVDWASDVIHTNNRRGFTDAITGAIFARAHRTEPLQRIKDFYRIVVTNICEAAHDTAAARLSAALMRETMTRAERYAKTEAALRAFCDYRPLASIQAVTREIFPLLEEDVPEPPERRRRLLVAVPDPLAGFPMGCSDGGG